MYVSSFLGIPSSAPFIPFGYKNSRHPYQEDICPRAGLQWRPSFGRWRLPGWPRSSSWAWPSWPTSGAAWSRPPRTWTCGTWGRRCNTCKTWTIITGKYLDPGKWFWHFCKNFREINYLPAYKKNPPNKYVNFSISKRSNKHITKEEVNTSEDWEIPTIPLKYVITDGQTKRYD